MEKISKVFLKLLIIFSITCFGVGIGAQTPQTTPQKKPLTLTNILVALGSQKIQDMDEKNRILIEAVIDRGVTFAVTPEIEDELKRAGASEILINTIKMKTQATQPANPTPTPAPQPQVDYTTFEKRADSYVQRGKYELAIPLYDQAITLSPRVSSLYVKRGFALFNTQDYDLALADYNKAIDLNSKDATAFFYRAQLYEKSGNLENALEDYQKAAELDPNNEQIKTALKNLAARVPKPTPSPSQIASANTTPPVQPPVTQPSQTTATQTKENSTQPKNESKKEKSEPKNEPKKESNSESSKNSKNEAPKNEPPKSEPPKNESIKNEPPKNEVAKNEPPKSEKQESSPNKETKNANQSSNQPSNSKPAVTDEQINDILNTDLEDIVIGVGQITASDIVELVRPSYPQVAQRSGIAGQVKVEVTWDGQGKVISAKAVEGPSLLRGVSEDAARKSKFKPRTIEGKPVKARGYIVFNFARQQ